MECERKGIIVIPQNQTDYAVDYIKQIIFTRGVVEGKFNNGGISFLEILGDLPQDLQLRSPPAEGLELRNILDYLVSEGELSYLSGGRYGLPNADHRLVPLSRVSVPNMEGAYQFRQG